MKTPERFHTPVGVSARSLIAIATVCFTLFASAMIFAQNAEETISTRTKPISSSLKEDAKAGGKIAEARTVRSMTKARALSPAPSAPEVASNYTFTTATNASLNDMSSGTTQLLGADIDDTASALTNIGFDFYFQGARFTQFSINDNGVLRLGATAQTGSPYKPLAQASIPIITAYGADQRTHAGDGKVHFKVTGSAPNRVLTVEWLNNQANFNPGGTADLTYQVRLYETTGVIELVYGSMTMSTQGAANTNSRDPNIGFSSSNVAGTVGSIAAPQSGTPAPSFDGTSATATANLYTAGAITVLTSAAQGSRRIFTLTPPTPTAPTGLNFTGVTANSMMLNWSDSPNELSYVIYNSTDGTNFSFAGTAAQNATSFPATGLTPGTNYFWNVYAISEGALSTVLSGSQMTNAPGAITSTAAGGNWSAVATWVGGVVPTATDNVTIADGATVTIDVTTAACFNLTVGQGTSGILQYISTPASTLTVNGNVTVTTGGTFTAGAGSLTTHVLNIGGSAASSTAAGNLMVAGTFDMNTTAGVTTNFFGSSNGTVSGGGATCDFFAVVANKGNSTAPVLDVTRVITMNAPAASASRLTATNGTFKLSSASVLTPWFGSQTIIAATGRLWLNNAAASTTVVGVGTGTGAGSPTINGTLQIDHGTFGYGSGNNTMTIGATGTLSINNADAMVNMFGAIAFTSGATFTMSAGNLNVDPQASNNLAATTNVVRFNSNTVNFTGGTLTIVDPHAATGTGRALSISTSNAATFNFNGGTISFGNGVSTTAGSVDGFDIDTFVGLALVPIGNVTVNNTATNAATRFVRANVALTPFQIIINGDLNVTNAGGSQFNLNGTLVAFGKNIINNGTIDGTVAASRMYFLGNGVAQTYSGNGTVTTPLVQMDIDNPLGVTFDPVTSGIVIGSRINLFKGTFTNSNKLTLGNGGANAKDIQYGVAGGVVPGGNFDQAPGFNLGTGIYTVTYAQESVLRTTSVEIPAALSRTVTNVVVNNTNGVTLGSDLNVAGTLTLTAGNFNIGANTLTLNAPTAGTATNLMGDATSSIVLNGTTAINLPSNIVALNNLTLNNSAGTTQQAPQININGTLALTQGEYRINAKVLHIDGPLTIGTGTINGAGTSKIAVGGTGATLTLPAITGGLNILKVIRPNGVILGAPLNLNSELILLGGTLDNSMNNVTLEDNLLITREVGSITTAPILVGNVNLEYAGTTPITTGPEVPISLQALINVSFDNPGGVTLGSTMFVNGQLGLGSGAVTTSAVNMLIISPEGTVSRTNGFINGPLQRFFGGTSTKTFDVGTGATYSPVTVSASAVAGGNDSLTVTAEAAPLTSAPSGGKLLRRKIGAPSGNPTLTLNRTWTISSSGVQKGTLTFTYDNGDVNGNEALYSIYRKNPNDQRFLVTDGAADNVDDATNTATTIGTVAFSPTSNWSLGAPGQLPPVAGQPRPAEIFDLDGSDSKTDVAIWNKNSGNWTIINSGTGASRTQLDWGHESLGDRIVPGDYDGDTRTDVAVWREPEGNWYIVKSTTGMPLVQGWGQSGDKPAVGDFDGDGKTDFTVFRPSEGNWYILKSGGGNVVRNWGDASDQRVLGDYDGDGKTDLAVFRASEGNWYIINSSTDSVTLRNWGVSTDEPVPGDYDGDGRADIAIFRPSEGAWYIINSSDNSVTVRNWGNADDILVPADYDRDGRTDLAVFRESESNFYILRSSDGNVVTFLYSGASRAGDLPDAGPNIPVASAPNIP